MSNGFSTPCYNGVNSTANNSSNICAVGINNLFNEDLTNGCFEPLFSKGINTPTMLDGIWQPVATQKRTFCIPIYSGIFGILMPRSSYKYIPMLALEDLTLEFRLSPYALFAAGYRPANGKDSTATWNVLGTDAYNKYGQIPRKWKISKFEIVTEMLFLIKILIK